MFAKCGANRPSRLVAFPEFVIRLVRLFVSCQKTTFIHRKLKFRLFAAVRADSRKNTQNKQHLCIENYTSGPNMQTSTSLTFFTAIFVAFSGALAEELMMFCRDVRTELYNRLQWWHPKYIWLIVNYLQLHYVGIYFFGTMWAFCADWIKKTLDVRLPLHICEIDVFTYPTLRKKTLLRSPCQVVTMTTSEHVITYR